MPPVGQNLSCGQGAATDFSQAIPPDGSAGKNLRTRKPSAESVSASDTLVQPGSAGTGAAASAAASVAVVPGLTRYLAPTASAAATSASPSTVPAPTPHSGTCAAIAAMASSATRVRSVTSMTFNPPAASARASGTACSTRSMVSTGTTGVPERSGMGSGGDMTVQALAALLGYLSGVSRTSERSERRSGTQESLPIVMDSLCGAQEPLSFSHQPILRKIAPSRIVLLDQIELPTTLPSLELALVGACLENWGKRIDVDQPVNSVFAGKS